MAFLDNEGLQRLWGHITNKLLNKVDKVEGKSLSTNDYTTEEKEKLASAVTEASFNEELNKRPIAYAPGPEEKVNIDFGFEIDETGYVTRESFNKFLEGREYDIEGNDACASYSIYIPELNLYDLSSISTLPWIAGKGEVYEQQVTFNSGLLDGGAIYNFLGLPEYSQYFVGPHFWRLEGMGQKITGLLLHVWFPENEGVLGDGFGDMDIKKEIPSGHILIQGPAGFKTTVIVPGKKIDPSLIDTEWMAVSNKKDLDIIISEENADEFELFGGIMAKISDVAPSKEQMIGANITIDFVDKIVITEDDIISLYPEVFVVGEILLVVLEDITWDSTTISKGMYLKSSVSNILEHIGASSIAFHIPNADSIPNILPNKFLPDTVVQAWEPIEILKNINCNLEFGENGYVIEESFDRFLKDKEYYKNYDCGMWYTIKLSNECIPKEELSKVTSFNKYIGSNNFIAENIDAIFIDDRQISEYFYGVAVTLGNITGPEGYLIALINQPSVIIVTPAANQFTEWSPGTYLRLFVTRREDDGYENTEIPEGYCQIQGPIDFSFPHIINPGKKIDPELIDGEIPYRKVVIDELKIEFDGDIDKYEDVLLNENMYMVKLSNIIPTVSEFEAGSAKIYNILEDTIIDYSFNGNIIQEIEFYGTNNECIICVIEPIQLGEVELSPGLWTIGDSGMMLQELYIPSVKQTIVKKLDGNMVDLDWSPQIKGHNDIVVFEQANIPNNYTITDCPELLSSDLPELTIVTTVNGTEYVNTPMLITNEGSSGIVIGNLCSFGTIDTGEPFTITIMPRVDGALFTHTEDSDVDVKIAIRTPIVDKLPAVYLPDTVATKNDLAALAAQISALNTTLQNTLEGAE